MLKLHAHALTRAAGAVALLLAGCGGGGGGVDGGGGPAQASLQVSGTAATGAALAAAAVEVKCATGRGTATTGDNGTYSVTIADGALPCMIEVKKSLGDATVTLHSVADAGTPEGARTSAVAHVTPVTELVVARLLAAPPEDSFGAFQASAVSRAQLQAATAAVVAALGEAGIDLSAIDPLKAELVARTASTSGNGHDQMLDALGAKVDDDALKALARQVADAARAGFDDGVKSAMLGAVRGALPGCPVAVSGMYRTADVMGTLQTHSLDFEHMRMRTAGTQDSLVLSAHPSEACVFTASGPFQGAASNLQVVMGANGIGTFRADRTSANLFEPVGVVFPAQSHSVAALQGTWSLLQTDVAGREHIAAQVTVGADGKVTSCDYDSTWTCVPNAETQAAAARSDGGISIPVSATEEIRLYAYRAPGGDVALFGGAQPTSNVAVGSRSFVAAKLAPLAVPAAGTVMSSWDGGLSIDGNGVIAFGPLSPTSYTVTASDAAAGFATRQNDATARVETLQFNTPLAGVRSRASGTFGGAEFARLVQIPLPGMGITFSINALPWGRDTSFIHNIAVVK